MSGLDWELVRSLIRLTHDPGYVLVGLAERVYRLPPAPDMWPLDRAPAREDEAVHQALADGWLERGARLRLPAGIGDDTAAGRVVRLVVSRNGIQRFGQPRTLVYQGRTQVVELRQDTAGPGTRTEYWPRRGYVSSYREFLGHRYAAALIWAATVNRTGRPADAEHGIDGLRSRRAALDWLFTQTEK